VKVYLNAQEVLNQPKFGVLRINANVVANITLREGTNVLVLKVINQFGTWSACVRFVDEDGQSIPNLKAMSAPGG